MCIYFVFPPSTQFIIKLLTCILIFSPPNHIKHFYNTNHCHNINEILFEVVLNTINQTYNKNLIFMYILFIIETFFPLI